MMKNISVLFIVLLLFSCRAEEITNPEFTYLDMEDAYGFVLGKPAMGVFTDQKLYKINNSDKLIEVKYLDEKKNKLMNIYVPVAMYDLNKTYFLVTFSNIYQTEYETYIIRRIDGLARRLAKPVLVEKAGKIDMNTHAIRSDNNFGSYFLNTQGNWKVSMRDAKSAVPVGFLIGEMLGENFVTDYLGNTLTAQKVYSVNGYSQNLVWANPDYTYPIQSFINNMYYIFRKGDSVQCSQIDVSTATIAEKKLYPSFLFNIDEAKFIGSHAFSDINKIVAVLASGILVINESSITKADMTKLNLKKIYKATFSGKYCFVYGENPVKEKVFSRIDLKGTIPVYTQIMAPNDVEIIDFSASAVDNLVFSAKRLSGGKHIYGFIPFNGSNWIFDNDEGIEDLQVLAR